MRCSPLLPEQLYLAEILSTAAATPSRSNHRQHSQRLQCVTWHKNSLRIGAQVWRIDEKALSKVLGKVVGHHAFHHLAVLKAQSDPQAFSPRTTGERLSQQRLRIAELAHEKNTLDLFEVDGYNVARSIEQFELALMNEIGR